MFSHGSARTMAGAKKVIGGKGSRLTIENGTMGSCVVPRDPNRLLEENEV